MTSPAFSHRSRNKEGEGVCPDQLCPVMCGPRVDFCRVTLVAESGLVVLDRFVKPRLPIIDYNTVRFQC